jgi:hypothetical protein
MDSLGPAQDIPIERCGWGVQGCGRRATFLGHMCENSHLSSLFTICLLYLRSLKLLYSATIDPSPCLFLMFNRLYERFIHTIRRMPVEGFLVCWAWGFKLAD